MDTEHEANVITDRLEWSMTVNGVPYEKILYDGIEIGPSLLQIPVEFMPGTSLQKLKSQHDDIVFHMGLETGIRITGLSDHPGCALFQVSRSERMIPDITELPKPSKTLAYPRLALGVMPDGSAYDVDLDALPHLLVAGCSGSGKSTFLRSLAYQLTHHYSPDQLELAIIDGKGGGDYARFRHAEHLSEQGGFCVNHHEASDALEDIVERRLEERKRLVAAKAERAFHTSGTGVSGLRDSTCWTEEETELRPLVVILDELAELGSASNQDKHLGDLLTRFTQCGRALGAHLIAATQRPSAAVVSGDFKANCARLACRVGSKQDSRIILDEPGAESLLDRGDLLFRSPQQRGLVRLQGFRA